MSKQINFNTSYLNTFLWNKGLSKAFWCSLVCFCVEYSMMNVVLIITYYFTGSNGELYRSVSQFPAAALFGPTAAYTGYRKMILMLHKITITLW